MREYALFAGFGLVVSSVVTPAPVRAELWGEGRAGVGIASGHYEFEKGYTRATGEAAVAHDEGGPLGLAFVLEGMGGYAVSPTVAFGLIGRVEITPYLENVSPRYATVDTHALVGVGPLLVLRPGKSLDLRAGMEWVSGRFAGSIQEIGAEDNVFDIEPVSGPGALLSLGCCSERGFGIAMEAHVARLQNDHTLFVPVTFTLMATLATR
jgi:hypothetical protein